MSVSIDQIRGEIARRLEPPDGWAWVREMFTDRAILEIEVTGQELQLVEVAWTLPDEADLAALELGEPVEVELEYVAKAEGGPRLAGPIVRKDAARQIAYAPVLVPGEPDADGEELTAAKIEEVAHRWLEDFRAFDVQHSVKTIDAAPVESYLEPTDRVVEVDGEDVTLPAGTWTVAVKVRDADVWQEITDGKRAGLSVMGVPEAQLEAAIAALKSGSVTALKRVTLADVGGGDPNGPWVAPLIGIVDQPAVPKAKWFAFKAAPAKPSKPRRLWDALTGGAVKEGRRFSDATYTQLKSAAEAITALVAEAEKEREGRADKAHGPEDADMTPEQVKSLVAEAVPGAVKAALTDALGDALKPISERLDAIDSAGKEAGGNEPEPAADELAGHPALKELAEKVDRIEQRTRAGSRQPDEPGEVEPALKHAGGRDAFGRRITAG